MVDEVVEEVDLVVVTEVEEVVVEVCSSLFPSLLHFIVLHSADHSIFLSIFF